MELKIGEMVRQGDLGIIRIDKMPTLVTGALEYQKDGVILRGEVTNHNHKSTSGQVYIVKDRSMLPDGEKFRGIHAYLQLEQPTEIVHPEHGTISLGTGIYKVIRQRELNNLVMD